MELENINQLAFDGYTVVKGLSRDEVHTARDLFQKWYEANQIRRRPISPHGIIKHWNIGHTAFAWYIRTRPSVQDVWAAIFGTRDLVVSFDGACYMPPGLNRSNSKKGWLHVDQAPNNPEWACVQGFVALTSNTEATLGLVPGSHLRFQENTQDVKVRHKRWVPLPNLDASGVIRVPVEAGDIVLWDSRVAHMNFYGPEERLVQYVSFLPRIGASKRDLHKRQVYFRTKRTTSHWAYPLEVVGKQPQTFGNQGLKIDYESIRDPTPQEFWDHMDPDINKLV